MLPFHELVLHDPDLEKRMEGYKLGIQKVCIFFKKASKVINEGGRGAY